LAIRRIIASRISGIKKFTGAELPIISEIPVPAEEIEAEYFDPRELARPASIEGIIDWILRMPKMAWGKANGREAGRWYSVSYGTTLTSPSVVCVGQGRSGEITYRDIILSYLYWWHCNSCLYSWLALHGRTFSRCPECNSTNIYSEPVTRDSTEWMMRNLYWWAARKGLGDWGAFNWLRDLVIAAFEWLGRAMGRITYALIDNIKDQVFYIRDRVNQRLEDLYEMWGIPRNIALTPLHVRNVTSSGFQFLSLGDTTAYWFAIGK